MTAKDRPANATLQEVLDMEIKEFAGFSVKCAGCGRTHSAEMDSIAIGPGMDAEVLRVLDGYKGRRIFMINDSNTRRVLGERIKHLLQDNGHADIGEYTYKDGDSLHTDEKSLGRLMIEADKKAAVFVTVGSGTLNDITRMVSFKMGIPYIIIGTAPSMDGYTSASSPVFIDGRKVTLYAWQPRAIVADTDVMRQAPLIMLQAGIGDIIGKYTALQDWKLSSIQTGEYHCSLVESMIRNAVAKCVANVGKLIERDEMVIRYAVEGLVLTGISMGFAGTTRPASGSEHMMGHYWEDDALSNHTEYHLHGIYVGAATYVVSLIYDMFRNDLPAGMEVVPPDEIKKLLDAAGCPTNPGDLNISKGLLRESILRCDVVRPKYTILKYASEKGKLEAIADKITDMFYR